MRSAKLSLPGSGRAGLSTVTHLKSQATIPSQAGTSCKAGASTARSRDGQPSPKQHSVASPGTAAEGAEPSWHPKDADVQASVPRGSSAAFKAVGGPARLGRVKGAPVPRLRGVKGTPVPSTVTRTLAAERPPARSPPESNTLGGLALVCAHPPCSRKGPLLPSCGLKRPRRVKREATNSRFCGFWT